MGFLATISDPKVARHLLSDEGEHVVDEVKHHWVAYVRAVLEVVLGVALLIWMPFIDLDLAWVLIVAALVLWLHGAWVALDHHRDRFVITNMRVFRVHGVLATHMATMPLQRILDISVKKPLVGRVLGYGHFVFESAAQAQGLRDIRYVGDPDARDLTIQRVVQRSGVRGKTVP